MNTLVNMVTPRCSDKTKYDLGHMKNFLERIKTPGEIYFYFVRRSSERHTWFVTNYNIIIFYMNLSILYQNQNWDIKQAFISYFKW